MLVTYSLRVDGKDTDLLFVTVPASDFIGAKTDLAKAKVLRKAVASDFARRVGYEIPEVEFDAVLTELRAREVGGE